MCICVYVVCICLHVYLCVYLCVHVYVCDCALQIQCGLI